MSTAPAGQGAALHTVLGEVAGLLIGPLSDAHALHADGQTRRVHHDEHVFDAAIFLADQEGLGPTVIAIGHHSGRARMHAHLVFQ